MIRYALSIHISADLSTIQYFGRRGYSLQSAFFSSAHDDSTLKNKPQSKLDILSFWVLSRRVWRWNRDRFNIRSSEDKLCHSYAISIAANLSESSIKCIISSPLHSAHECHRRWSAEKPVWFVCFVLWPWDIAVSTSLMLWEGCLSLSDESQWKMMHSATQTVNSTTARIAPTASTGRSFRGRTSSEALLSVDFPSSFTPFWRQVIHKPERQTSLYTSAGVAPQPP